MHIIPDQNKKKRGKLLPLSSGTTDAVSNEVTAGLPHFTGTLKLCLLGLILTLNTASPY